MADKGTEDVFDGENTKAARKVCPTTLFGSAGEVLDALQLAKNLNDLKGLGYGLHKVRTDRKGQWAVSINKQYRVCLHGPRRVLRRLR